MSNVELFEKQHENENYETLVKLKQELLNKVALIESNQFKPNKKDRTTIGEIYENALNCIAALTPMMDKKFYQEYLK